MLLGLAGPAVVHAQSEGQYGDAYPLADKDISTLVTGDFDADGRPDAVVLADGHAVLLATVEVERTHLESTATGVDIALLPGSGSQRDRIAMVGPTGLWVLEYSGSAWSETNVRDSGTLWSQAVAVATGELDTTAGCDIAGLTTNKLLRVSPDGSGWGSDAVKTIPTGSPTDLVALQWQNAAGPLELVVVGPQGVSVYDYLGVIQYFNVWNQGPVLAARVGTPAEADRLVAVRTVVSTGVQTMVVYDSATGPESPAYLGPMGATALTTGDWDDDGYDDLFLSITTASSVLGMAYDVSGAPTFSIYNSIEYPVGPPSRDPSGQDAGLSACDVDHDGDLDLVVGLQGSYSDGTWWFDDPRLTQVELVRNSTSPEWDYYPASNRAQGPNPWQQWSIDADLSDPTTLGVTLGRPLTVLSQGGTEAEIDVRVWRTPYLQGKTEAAPVYTGTSPMPAAGVPLTLANIYVGETDCSAFEALYTVEARQVLRISGAVVAQGPALTALVCSGTNGQQAVDLHTIVCVARGDLNCATEPPPEPEGEPFVGLAGGTLGGPGPPPFPPGQGP